MQAVGRWWGAWRRPPPGAAPPINATATAAGAPPSPAAVADGGASSDLITHTFLHEGLQPDDQTCLRGGDAAAPRTLIETLSSAALRRLLRVSGAAYAVAILYTAVLVAVGHAHAVEVGLPTEVFGTEEVVWTIVLLWAAAIYAVPITEYEALLLFRLFLSDNEDPDDGAASDASEVLLFFLALGAVAFAGFILWYGSTTVASFRKLEGSRGRVRFYLPRTVLLVIHVALRVNAYVSLPGAEVAFSIFPVASVAYLLRLVVARPVSAPLSDDPFALGAAVAVISVEAVLVGVLLVEMRLTAHTLGRSSFARTRRKHVAHRFYRLHARRMAIASSLCVLLTAVAPPIGLNILVQRAKVLLVLTEALGHGPPFRLLVTTYVLVEAILALPPHVTGVRALFSRPRRVARSWEADHGDELSSNASIASSVSTVGEGGAEVVLAGGAAAYRTRLREAFVPLPGDGGGGRGGGGIVGRKDAEGGRGRSSDVLGGRHASGPGRIGGRLAHAPPPRGRRRLDIRPGTFVLTTAAKLLNLSWLAYNQPPPPTPYLCPRWAWGAPDRLISVKRIYHGPTDTLVLFVRLPDRLVVAFRGTVSATNTWTDLAVSLIPVEAVGNAAWVSLVNSLVPDHWRCVVANDVITTVPPFRSYAHAGTAVLLDLAGDLFIDPLTATKRTLHGGAVSIRFHGRSAYMLALSAVGVSRFHGSSSRRRLFWRWPLPPVSKHLLGAPRPPKARLSCLTGWPFGWFVLGA
ncbi:hypothetical protein I4F81_004435 [Pyropia yezoensis]|uniref:Uncharacterized protein n=1 Tax=Pyropia yezoensis TaxID=2788 RepID=A0ACC3BUZ4_PYRYE|nr:hypothetical protein I4F81_004435 [Neopyropia yezoensis]